MRVRQIALVAEDLDATLSKFNALLGLRVALRDPRVEKYGLANGVMPVGDEFIEVIAPVQAATTAGRYLQRRQGDGGYMVILQAPDPGDFDDHLAASGVRVVTLAPQAEPPLRHYQLHPRDTGGTFLAVELAERAPEPGEWDCAGPDWRSAVDISAVRGIGAISIQSDDPERLARRWSQILRIPMLPDAAGHPCLPTSNGPMRFVIDRDGRGEGLAGVEFIVSDWAVLHARAAVLGLTIGLEPIDFGGMACAFR